MQENLNLSNHQITSLETQKTSIIDFINVSISMQNYRNLYNYNLTQEQNEKKNIDLILQDIWIIEQKNITNNEQITYQIKKSPDKLDKQKLVEYWKLADLSYVKLKTDSNQKWNERFIFYNLLLDPKSYSNIAEIALWNSLSEEKISILSNEEKELYNFIQNWLNNNDDYIADISTSEEKIFLSSLWLNEQIFAENEIKYRDVITDIMPEKIYNHKYNKSRLLINKFFKNKINKSKNQFEKLKQNYKIIDYYPNETKGEKWESWFWAILLEKWWKKFIAIRWTEITDFWDLKEDSKLAINKFPDKQSKDLINFIDRVIKPGEKFNIIWHSLWWALSQIAASIYVNQIEEAYTFNSPWVKNLKVSDKDKQKFVKFRDFEYNKDKVWEKIINVRWSAWISPIANLWEDLWNYEIILKKLSSHGITETVRYIEKLDRNSEELNKVKVKKVKEINKESNY